MGLGNPIVMLGTLSEHLGGSIAAWHNVRMTDPAPELFEELRFRQNLQKRREAHGWSMGELARRMEQAGWTDFHQATVSRIEKGQRGIGLGEARTLARLLGVDLGAMIATSDATEAVYAANEAQAAYTRGWSKVVEWVKKMTRAEAVLRARLDELTARIEQDEYPDEGQRSFAQATLRNGRLALEPTIVEAAVKAVNEGIRQGTDE